MDPTSNTTASYGPDPLLAGVWITLTGVAAPIWIMMALSRGSAGHLAPLLISVGLPLATAVFIFRFKATFTHEAFIYRRWGPTISVRYDDIAFITVTNTTPLAGEAIGAFIVTRTGERLPFWPKLFPREAVTRFFKLAERMG